jgi:2-keto-4-pentenoate hydratase/2-oxohepta-3-ene-1,7-dioic acid hydratase in catechol pathway
VSRWARFLAGDRQGFGVVRQGLLEEYEGDMFTGARPSGRQHALGNCRLLSPCRPRHIVALWNNFHALAAKLGKAAPAHPLFLLKAASSLAGPGDVIKRPGGYSGKIAFEGELAIVIGGRCAEVSADDAPRYIFGYTCINDVTAGEILNENPDFPQWTRSKSFPTFSCVGPWIETDLEFSRSNVVTRLDGVERQNYPLSDMVFAPNELVSRLSWDMELQPGDVIACGTSLGVGSMKDGATVEIEIDGIGCLKNTVSSH